MEHKEYANENERILPRAAVIQDISGFTRVSLTEAIPILAAMGIEVCPLPTAVLSTHTYEYTGYTLLDMTEEMPKIIEHWNRLGLEFDAVYSGYLSSGRQIGIIYDFMQSQKQNGALCIVDPVLGDNALTDVKTVYSNRMTELIDGMRRLCGIADVITPNLTEACLLLCRDYPNGAVSDGEIKDILFGLTRLGTKSAVITSVMDGENSMCVAVCSGGNYYKISCDYIDCPFHGTGDIFTSVLTGALLGGNSVEKAANIAADFVARAIALTARHREMPIRHGALFEPVLQSGYFAPDRLCNIPDRIKIL